MVEEILHKATSKHPKGNLFQSNEKSKPFSNWSRAKAQLDELSGVTDFTLHDLRRTYATNLQRLGVRLEVIESLLNHVSGTRSGLVGIYQVHRWEEEMREAVIVFERWFQKLLQPSPSSPSARY
jgi:integrase